MNDTTPQSSPLTEQHYQALNGVLQGCSALEELLGKCQAAGLDVNAQVKQNRQRQQLASGLKSAFFPERP